MTARRRDRYHPMDLSKTTPGTEQYDQFIDNEFRSVARQPLSTFAIDVDTASYANVRRFLNEGRLPPPDAVRIEEMINYFPYDYAPPSDGKPFAVNMEVAGCPWQPEHRLLRVGLKGREIDRQRRGPSNLVFLLDVSGSMGEPDKLPLVKQAMRMLVEQLTEDDRVAIVTYADGTDLRLPSARGDEHQRIIDAIESLQAGGCTYGSAGIELAYRQAVEHFLPRGVNRIILCTDGDLNVGITDDDDLVRLIQKRPKAACFSQCSASARATSRTAKWKSWPTKATASTPILTGCARPHRVLVEQMTGHLVTIAKDVKIQIEFNPAEVAEYRLVGYENRVMAHRDFDNDRKQAGDIGAGHTVTALYELVPARGGNGPAGHERPLKYQRVPKDDLTEQARGGEWLTLRLRYKEPEQNESRLLEFTARDSATRFDEASADFRFASAVAAFGMVLRGSPHRGQATLAAVEEYAAAALGKDPNGHRAEFLDLVRKRAKPDAGEVTTCWADKNVCPTTHRSIPASILPRTYFAAAAGMFAVEQPRAVVLGMDAVVEQLERAAADDPARRVDFLLAVTDHAAGHVRQDHCQRRHCPLGVAVHRLDVRPALGLLLNRDGHVQRDHLDVGSVHDGLSLRVAGDRLPLEDIRPQAGRIIELDVGLLRGTNDLQRLDFAGPPPVLDHHLAVEAFLEFKIRPDKLAVEPLFDGLRLGLKTLAGHLHAGLDFQRHAVVVDVHQGGFGVGRIRADHLAVLVERLGHDADQFPGAGSKRPKDAAGR